jgi:hypothetical protein
LVKAGVLPAGEGLHPTRGQARPLRRRKKTLIDGPFAETTQLVAGY